MNATTTSLEQNGHSMGKSAEESTKAAFIEQKSLISIHREKLIAFSVWAVLIALYFGYSSSNNLTPLAAMRQLIVLMQNSLYGPMIFILFYAMRPLIFFSAALLTVAAGFLFGPIWGVVYTIIGSNTSAMIAYMIGRYFGKGFLEEDETSGLAQRYAKRLRNNSFETVLTMRFIFLPYDLVNYLGGLLHINWRAFLLATAVGSIPGTISFVLFGASIEGNFGEELPSINPAVLVAAVVIFVVSIGLSRYFKMKEKKRELRLRSLT